jgi:hypothetical protein
VAHEARGLAEIMSTILTVGGHIRQDDASALLNEKLCNRRSNSGRSASDDCHLIFKSRLSVQWILL